MRRVQSCVAVPENENVPNVSNLKDECDQIPLCDAARPDVRRVKSNPVTATEHDAAALQCIRPHNCKVGVSTDRGGVPFMEDAHCVHKTDREAAFCVYDGHGGAQAAHFCREHLHLNVMACLERGEAPADALVHGFARTEAELLREQQLQATRLASGSPSAQCLGGELCGSTALVALLRGGVIHVGWLGDCRAVLCRGGEAVELTRDHVLSGEGGEVARVLGEGGRIEGGRLSGFLEVARALGDLDQRTGRKPEGLSGAPELRSQPVELEDEFLILGSDGLWQLLGSRAAVDIARADLRAHADAAMAAEKLVDAALARKSDDNITAMVVLLRPVAPDAAARQRPRLPLMKRASSVPAALSVAPLAAGAAAPLVP